VSENVCASKTGANVDFRKVEPGSEAMLSVFVKSSDTNWEKFLNEVLVVMREERSKERKRCLEQVRATLHEEIRLWSKRGWKFIHRNSPQGTIDEIQESMCRIGNRIIEQITGKPVKDELELPAKRRRKKSGRR
jgi:hypothetical protein